MSTQENIRSLIQCFEGKKVLVIGDLMVDAYLWGNVRRISPEAPVPVVNITQRDYRMGGAANVALNLKALGAEVMLAGICGKDASGEQLAVLMNEAQLDSRWLMASEFRPTTVKNRIISSSQHMLRVDEESTEYIKEDEEHAFLTLLFEALEEEPDVVIFEDYNKGVLSSGIIHKVIAVCNRKGILTTVDPKYDNFFEYRDVTLFKPNLKELAEGTKTDIDKQDDASVAAASAKLRDQLNARYIMTTLSERGVFIMEGDDWKRIPAHVRNIADVSGAGDTVISVAALCLACGASPETMAWLSNLAGGIVCESVGVVPIDKQTLLNEALKLSGE